MLTRLFFVAVIAIVTAGIANSQSPATAGLPEKCRGVKLESLAVLEKRKLGLERAIARAEARDNRKGERRRARRQLSPDQAALLAVVLQIECVKAQERVRRVRMEAKHRKATRSRKAARPGDERAYRKAEPPRMVPPPAPGPELRALPPPAKTRSTGRLPESQGSGGTAKPGSAFQPRAALKANGEPANAVEVTTYFATNRARTGSSKPAEAYNAKVAALSYGRAVVSIPKTHETGSIELPRVWRLEFNADPERHFVLKEATALSADAAHAEITRAFAKARSKSLLLFVHGYNTSFEEAAMRTAQLAYDLNFGGVPLFFSWPSAASLSGYWRDEDTVELSETAFDRALDDLSRLPANSVYVVAHSMGSRLVSRVLRSRVDRGKPIARLSELLLAAPDINADLFRREIAPRLAAMQGVQTTLYASSDDFALRASKFLHGYARVGEITEVYPGVDTVDASRASMLARTFGHSYLTDSVEVLKDIRAIVLKSLSARERGLVPVGTPPEVYWRLE